ncbi:hypothetical protein CHARACLAT_025824, partial [Characodon lateralis]|nr:hypothetical protein [Characodon lateralis]
KRSQSMKNLHDGSSSSTRKQPSGRNHQPADLLLPQDYFYDLYAVCNHHGGMHGGHYTAYCRNSVDGQWYSYDDSSVDMVPEDEVCTKGAYILFYQRRNIIPPWSASSSVRDYTTVFGLIQDSDESAYRQGVDQLVHCCGQNHLELHPLQTPHTLHTNCLGFYLQVALQSAVC